MQLEAIASRLVASYLGEETNTCLTTASFQAVVESDKVPPQTCSLDPSPASLPFSGHAPAPQCPPCSEGPENWTQYSKCGITSAEYRGTISNIYGPNWVTKRERVCV